MARPRLSLIVDASVAAKWFLVEEGSDSAEALLTRDARLLAPDFLLVEVANVGWTAARRGLIEDRLAASFARDARRMFHALVPSADLIERASGIAFAVGHPVYDCLYVALAERESALLVTADQRLMRQLATTSFAPLLRPLGAPW